MRCPNCGTENAPDSRFCGGCGLQQAQQQQLAQRLVPTAKIPDDAPLAPPTRPVGPITPIAGVSYSPPSMPPQAAPAGQAGLTTRPGGHGAPPRTGETPQVRASQPYGQVQRPPSQSFDSVAPTAQQRRPTLPEPKYPSGSEPPSPSRRPQASNASMSFSAPTPQRSLGLIALVLFIDLGLAGTGAFLLAKGLAKPETTNNAKASPEKKSGLPASSANAVTSVVSADPDTVAAPPAAVAAAPAAPATTTSAPEHTRAATAAGPPASVHASTIGGAAARSNRAASSTTRATTTASDASSAGSASDPVTAPAGPVTSPSSIPEVVPVTSVPTTATQPAAAEPPSTAAEVEAIAQSSAASVARCKGEAAVAGAIKVAFHVNPDGRVANAFAVENTTGSTELGDCIARVISGWRVSPFQGARVSFVRPFSFP